ncbi:MAG: DNA primase [Tissierellia bacterium]|nr:DNA primase [Tissierellia bacterium]
MSYIINEEVIERIHESANLVDVISEYLPLKKSGSNFVGLCPFHNEKTPSFTVSETKQFYHCFGCGEGGDIISFIMKMENMSFLEASEYLANKLGIPLVEKSKKEKKIEAEKEKLYEINREAARFYYYNLMKDEKALRYLQNRKIKRKTINQFGLGFAQDNWDEIYKYLLDKGYSVEELEKAGLIGMRKDKSGYYDKFRNRIIFPIIDTRGRIIGFGGRVLDDTMPKYLNSKDSVVFTKGNNLFGLNLVRKQSNRERIILVEGYMDVIALFNNGINYAVASLGTAFTPEQGKLLQRYGKEIYICYDSDTAGINATTRAINILKREGIEAKVILLPINQDPDDFIKEKGVKEFERLMKKALNYIDYNIFLYKQKYNINNPEERIKFTQEISKILRRIKSPIERDVYIDKISKETEISKEAIEKEILVKDYSKGGVSKDKYINRGLRYNKDKIEPVNVSPESGHLKAEKLLLKLMIANKSYFDIINRYLTIEDFLNYECSTIAEIVFKEYDLKPQLNSIDQEFIFKNIESKEELDQNILEEILIQDAQFLSEDMDKIIEDSIKTLNFSKLKLELDNVTKKIQEFDGENMEEFKALSIRQMELKNQLESYI